jgi:serine/threonine protein phosphatase PrpC
MLVVVVQHILPRFDFRVDVAVAEDIGAGRKTHEDAHLIAPDLAVFAVADGMGGQEAGELAARIALDEIKTTLSNERSLALVQAYVERPGLDTRRKVLARMRRAVERANHAVRKDAVAHPERLGMGTTVDVLWLARHKAFLAHAGDGRIYLARERATLQLTQDHARIAALQAGGELRPTTKLRNSGLINAVGLSDTIAVDTLFVELGRGDRVLLCSDGVHGVLPREADLDAMLRRGTPAEAARALVARGRERGTDNATALVVEIGERFVKRSDEDRGLSDADLDRARQNPLLDALPLPLVLAALSAAVEVEVPVGESVPCIVANDLVAYLVLEGIVRIAADRAVTTGALLFAESLCGVWSPRELPRVEQPARLLRIRADDFTEVCEDPVLGAELYRRLSLYLARTRAPPE